MRRKKLTSPQLWQLRKAVAENGCKTYGSEGTRLGRTLAKLGLAEYNDEKSELHPTEYGRRVAECGGYLDV